MKSTADRFWDKVDKSGECWLWTGRRNSSGYGSWGRRNILAHRFSWHLAFGEIPQGVLVCHRCDVRNCVRPEHLFLGSTKDNIADAAAKGRLPGQLKTHCSKGHPYDETNTRVDAYSVVRAGKRYEGTRRRCLTCEREGWKRVRERMGLKW